MIKKKIFNEVKKLKINQLKKENKKKQAEMKNVHEVVKRNIRIASWKQILLYRNIIVN